MPPPAVASTTSSFSCSWAFIISACICWTCFIIWFMFGCLGMGPRLPAGLGVVEDFLRPELVLEAFEELFLGEDHRRLRRQLAQVVPDVESSARERPHRAAHELGVALDLLLREAGVRLEADE